ncbi:MAG: class I SAM-dependent methyltransferase [Synechocystis sp.]|nr:class I SAM-dependent methyltransferase [Synechocystis sp.]
MALPLPANADENNPFLLETLADLLAMNYLAPLAGNYLPWSGYAMRPSGLVKILNQILLNQHLTIVECGGGISTFYIARLFAQNQWNGHLYCIENNQDWLNFLAARLDNEGLRNYVTLIDAPLKPCDFAIDQTPWYDPEKIRQVIPSSQPIDCLLVDGPPAYRPEIQYSRFPAVPFFKDQLATGSTILLDDINREGEQEILKRWQELLNISFDTSEGNVAISSRSQI